MGRLLTILVLSILLSESCSRVLRLVLDFVV